MVKSNIPGWARKLNNSFAGYIKGQGVRTASRSMQGRVKRVLSGENLHVRGSIFGLVNVHSKYNQKKNRYTLSARSPLGKSAYIKSFERTKGHGIIRDGQRLIKPWL